MSELTALDRARKILKTRIETMPAVAKAFGLSSDLKAIGAALDELESNAALNAEMFLLLYEANKKAGAIVGLSPASLMALGAMGPRAKMIALRLVHGKCNCAECMTAAGLTSKQFPVM